MLLPLRNHCRGLEVKLELWGQQQSAAKYIQDVYTQNSSLPTHVC